MNELLCSKNVYLRGRGKNEFFFYSGNEDVRGKRKKYPKLPVSCKRTLNTL